MEFLHSLFEHCDVRIRETTGSEFAEELLLRSRGIFSGPVHPNFSKWGLNKPTSSTLEALVGVHQLVSDVIVEDLFGGLFNYLFPNGLQCPKTLSPSQMVEFCRHQDGLLERENYSSTLFPCSKPGEALLFIVERCVTCTPTGEMLVHWDVGSWRSSRGLSSKNGHRLVLPK